MDAKTNNLVVYEEIKFNNDQTVKSVYQKKHPGMQFQIRHGGDPLMVALNLSPKLNFGETGSEDFRAGLKLIICSIVLGCCACSLPAIFERADRSQLCSFQKFLWDILTKKKEIKEEETKSKKQAVDFNDDGITEEDIDNLFLQEAGQRPYTNEDPPEQPYFLEDTEN